MIDQSCDQVRPVSWPASLTRRPALASLTACSLPAVILSPNCAPFACVPQAIDKLVGEDLSYRMGSRKLYHFKHTLTPIPGAACQTM